MGDPEKQETTAAQSDPAPTDKSDGGAAGGDIGLTMSYITSIPGILKIVEFFTLMLAFALAADTSYRWSRMEFFLFVTIFSWILVIAVFLLFAFNVVSKINLSIDWNMPVLVFAVVVAILLLISSSLMADSAHGGKGSWFDKLRAAAAFGFISMFVFIGDAVLHFLKINGKM
ncbi:plasmolipin-like [Oculina patagonica]